MTARTGLLGVWATILTALLFALAPLFAAGAGAQEAGCRGQVVVDAGHGGTDIGAVNARYGLKEKEQTLDVARRLEALLEADGHPVCMTRTADETLSNNDHYTYANTTGAEVLVSVHMNGPSNTATDYTATLFGKWRKDKDLAHAVYDELSTLPAAGGAGTIATRTPYSFASGVLLKSDMPATIAETVFITSEAEGRLLSDGTGARQQQIAEALEAGVEDYLATHQRGLVPSLPDAAVESLRYRATRDGAMSAAIETEKLTKTYGRSRGIRYVDLAVREGEVFGFLGPNGAGKTTTIRTLLGFLRPSEGRAWVFGMDVEKRSVEIRARVGNLPGEFALEDRMSGEELLRFFARLRGVRDLGYARELAERLGAELHRPMRRLSRGNKQKIGLIQAMFHRPPLLILDEPTSGLDPLVQEEFLEIVGEVRAEGRTVFFSSHVLSEVERVCDRVGIIRDGQLVTVEPTRELVNKAFRHVTLTFDRPVDPEPFGALPGVRDLKSDGERISFALHEPPDAVVKLAAKYRLVGLEYERPSLEEVFLTYYGEEGGGS